MSTPCPLSNASLISSMCVSDSLSPNCKILSTTGEVVVK